MSGTFCLTCYLCSKLFKSYRTFVKHFESRHSEKTLDHKRVKFVNQENEEVKVPETQLMDARTRTYKTGYLPWLAGIAEQINAALHPYFPGRWYKIDMTQVPLEYYKHFVCRLSCHVDSMRRVSHKRPPIYATSTTRISYKIFDLNKFVACIHEQSIVELKMSMLFSGNSEISQERPARMTLSDEIEAAIQRDPWNTSKHDDQRAKRPTLHASIEISEGQGRATREVEVIWWPELFEGTQHGQLTLRCFVDKINL